MPKHAKKRPYQCDKCSQSFHNKANLDIHLASGGGNNEPKNCKECQMKFCTTYGLSKHIRFVHLIRDSKPKKFRKQEYSKRMAGKKVSCKNCDQRFHSKVKMEYHKKNADTLTKCEHCDYKSCNSIGVSHHMRKIHGFKLDKILNQNYKTLKPQRLQYECTKCSYKTWDRRNLDIHTKSKGELRMCEHCDFKSCTKIGFSNHMKKVHGIKHHMKKVKTESIPLNGFKCPKCDQKFHNRVNLQYHEKCKQEVQICEDCGFKSCTYLGFLSHLRKTHGKKSEKSILKEYTNFAKPRIYNCIKCDQKFYSKENLEFHVKKIRDDVLSCSKCDFKSCTKIGLSIHFRKVHDISSDAVENVPDGAMILDVLEQKQSIPMTTHGRFMVS